MLEIMMIVFALVFVLFCFAIYQIAGEIAEDLRQTIDHGRKCQSSLERFYEEIETPTHRITP